MSRCEGASPTLDELRVAFTELLDRAVAHGEATPTETWLDNRVLDAIDDVARAWPQVPDELIAKARNRFARYGPPGSRSCGPPRSSTRSTPGWRSVSTSSPSRRCAS